VVIALALMAVVMAAVLPQFKNIENSWASKQGRSEALQNARILLDHLNRNLQCAVRIKAVSAPDTINGFIEYESSDGVTYRYEVGNNKNVYFGRKGNLSELGGPVSRLQFTCYGLHDFSTPTTDIDTIRLVKATIAVVNAAPAAQDELLNTFVHLRVSGNPGGITSIKPRQFSSLTGQESALAQIDETHYLCAYSDSIRGWAVVLGINKHDWTISKGKNRRFEDDLLLTPALERIDSEHFLCAYVGDGLDGCAIILTVNRHDWTITESGACRFADTTLSPTLCRIDDTHYLVAYTGADLDGWAAVLEVNRDNWTLSEIKISSVEFDNATCLTPALSRIDDRHFLCAYTGTSGCGWALVLQVENDWKLTPKPARKFDSADGLTPSLCRIDKNHHLCAYQGPGRNGWAVVLGVNELNWTVDCGAAYEFDSSDSQWPALCRIKDNYFLVAYSRPGLLANKAIAALLAVDTEDWTVTTTISATEHATDGDAPSLTKIDDQHALCAYDDLWLKGTATVLEVILGGGP